jgi:hypothetical protein
VKPPPVAIGAAAGLAVMALLAPATGGALGRLGVARAQRARLEAAAIAPPASPAIVAAGLAVAAGSREAAARQLIAQIRNLATRGGVLVEDATALDGAGALVTVRVRVSASEGAVLGLVDALERGTPLRRFERWRIESAGGTVRLSGEVVAPWR